MSSTQWQTAQKMREGAATSICGESRGQLAAAFVTALRHLGDGLSVTSAIGEIASGDHCPLRRDNGGAQTLYV